MFDGFDDPVVTRDTRAFINFLADRVTQGIYAKKFRVILLGYERGLLTAQRGKLDGHRRFAGDKPVERLCSIDFDACGQARRSGSFRNRNHVRLASGCGTKQRNQRAIVHVDRNGGPRMSAIPMEASDLLAAFRTKLKERTAPAADISAQRWSYRATAAVLDRFRPADLNPLDPSFKDDNVHALLSSDMVGAAAAAPTFQKA